MSTINAVRLKGTDSDPITLLPNPACGRTALLLNGDIDDHTVAQLTNAMGELIDEIGILQGRTMIDLGSYPPGVYFITVRDREMGYVKKLIIQ